MPQWQLRADKKRICHLMTLLRQVDESQTEDQAAESEFLVKFQHEVNWKSSASCKNTKEEDNNNCDLEEVCNSAMSLGEEQSK